jgi:ribosomal protein L37E
MARITRHHVPCRVCGKAHTNPASSTMCVECGAVYYANKLAKKHEERIADKADEQSIDRDVIALLRYGCGLSMKDADTFLKAFRICMENANG